MLRVPWEQESAVRCVWRREGNTVPPFQDHALKQQPHATHSMCDVQRHRGTDMPQLSRRRCCQPNTPTADPYHRCRSTSRSVTLQHVYPTNANFHTSHCQHHHHRTAITPPHLHHMPVTHAWHAPQCCCRLCS